MNGVIKVAEDCILPWRINYMHRLIEYFLQWMERMISDNSKFMELSRAYALNAWCVFQCILINHWYFLNVIKATLHLHVLILRLIPIFRIIEPRSNQVGCGVFSRAFRKRDLSSLGIDIQINCLLTTQRHDTISHYLRRSGHLRRRRREAHNINGIVSANGKPHRPLEQAHKLSARVSPIAAPAVTEGEKVAANGWKENAR